IGGKNNVGKTAFMEACFLSLADGVYDLYKKLLEIKTHRNVVNNLLLKNDRQQDLKQLILENTNIDIYRKDHYINKDEYEDYECGKTFIQKDKKTGNYIILTHYDNIEHEFDYAYSRIIELIDENINFSKAQFSLNFISQYSHTNNILNWIISEAKLQNKYDDLNKYLLEIFNVQNIDTIRNKPLIKTNDKYIELSEFGQGIKTFINIISSILLLKDDVIFIDEIENGIHYTNLDKLWEIILTISKQQNVQVFATTHSKECIESYARVAKKLKDDEITFLDMGRKKDGTVGMITMNSERFYREIEMDNEVRGW
ncbi:MAG: ATP-binding protein, partial [Epsilonproteobacteria bacterium]|nr:ATP-binding protein [Campylobacterota bacterium]